MWVKGVTGVNIYRMITHFPPVTIVSKYYCQHNVSIPQLLVNASTFHTFSQWYTIVHSPSRCSIPSGYSTLNVRGPSYLGLTRSISWLLMPWLLTSPGHQQPWYWLHRICRYFSYLRKDFKYLCQINVEEWNKMQIYVYVPSGKFSA